MPAARGPSAQGASGRPPPGLYALPPGHPRPGPSRPPTGLLWPLVGMSRPGAVAACCPRLSGWLARLDPRRRRRAGPRHLRHPRRSLGELRDKIINSLSMSRCTPIVVLDDHLVDLLLIFVSLSDDLGATRRRRRRRGPRRRVFEAVSTRVRCARGPAPGQSPRLTPWGSPPPPCVSSDGRCCGSRCVQCTKNGVLGPIGPPRPRQGLSNLS